MLRLDRGWSQFELAEECHISEDHINNIERGKGWVSLEVIETLADALGVPPISLLDYSKNDEFVKSGGLTRRAPRKPAKLIVRNKKVQVRVASKKRRK
jgi:transcriptional regulator with XRE-family HTH domain